MPVVIRLDGRVDAQPQRDLLGLAARTLDDQTRRLSRADLFFQLLEIVEFAAVETESGCRNSFGKLTGQDSHPDEVASMNPLEAAGDHGSNSQELRSLGGPVAGAAGSILLSREDEERDAFALVPDGRLV